MTNLDLWITASKKQVQSLTLCPNIGNADANGYLSPGPTWFGQTNCLLQ